MQTAQRLAWRNLLSLVAVVMLLLGSATTALAQATPDASTPGSDAGPALGDAVVLHDSSGDETIQIAATQLVDPDEALENADRGFHWVGLEVVVDNPTDADVDFNVYSITLVDAEGFVYNTGYGSRSSEDTESRPDFSASTIPAGEAASGWLFFQVINDATPAWIVFNDGFGSQQFAVLANLTGEAIEEGAETAFYDSSAEEIGTVSVDEIITDFQSTDSSITPTRGMMAVGVVVTLASTGSVDLQPNTYSFYLVDDFGYMYFPTYYFRSDESTSEYPDFPADTLAAGSSATGIILYEIPRDAAISYVTYSPDYTQLYIVAQPGPGSTVSGDTLTPVAAPTGEADDTGDNTAIAEETPDDSTDTGGEETGECVGVTDWAAATSANASFISDLFADVESIGDIDPDDLRDAADQVRDAVDEQESLEAPAVAQDLNDAVIAMLNLYADLFDDAADRLENGDDPADIEADFGNNPEFGTVLNDLFSATTDLGEACPDSDLGDFLG
jgi:hypothetical protein